MFEPEELRRQFWSTEVAWPSETTVRWLASLEILGSDAAALLHGLYSLAARPKDGEKVWAGAVGRVRQEAAREFCRVAWENSARWSSARRPPHLYWYLSWPSKLQAAAVLGVAEVADDKVCEELGEIVLNHRAYDDEVVGRAITALGKIGSPAAYEQLEKAASCLRHKPFSKQVAEKLARDRNLDVEMLRDKHAETAGIGRDGKRSWKIGPYEGRVYLREDGTVGYEYVDPSTGEKFRSLPREVYESSPEVPREISICKSRLKVSYRRQRDRMKEAMISSRRWNSDDWHVIFTGNPVMNNLARRLIW